jgi:hypothetical protein
VNRLPQTLCHHDAFPRNLFASRTPEGRSQTAAIDWALVGISWVGREIDMLVSNVLTHIRSDREQVRQRDRIVFEAYVEDLRDSGCHVDPRLARLGQIARSAIRPRHLIAFWALDDDRSAWLERILRCSIEEFADYTRQQVRHPWLDWRQEAQELLEVLG